MTLLLFLVILSILVFVHELGHFWVAKKNGILVEEFGFGLPPRIWGKKIGETTYSINALPIGGFVKLFGEDQAGSNEQETTSNDLRRAFFAQSKLVRAAVLLAGVTMNFLLGVVLFSIIYSIVGIPTPSGAVTIEAVVPNSPAAQVRLDAGERVFAVDGTSVATSDEFVGMVAQQAGKEIVLSVGKADGTVYSREVRVTPRSNPPQGEGALGVVVSSTEMKHYPLWQMPFRGAVYGLQEAISWGGMIFSEVVRMISGLLAGRVPADVGGPVRIYQATGEVAKAGPLMLLQFMAILSINLAVLNVLPLPALDGGRLLFLAIETVFRRRVHARFEQITHAVGMLVLLSLMVLITLNDIVQITGSGSLLGLFHKVVPF